MSLFSRITGWWRGSPKVAVEPAMPPEPGRKRGAVDHVIILDGTLSTLDTGQEGNAGLLFQLLAGAGRSAHRTLYYEAGSQWMGWRHGFDLATGNGLNRQIIRAYGWLASHYREGDRIYLFGYSRGAYAVRSLAGVIDRVGLLHQKHTTERAVTTAFRHYQRNPDAPVAATFSAAFCHSNAPIQMVGVWDSVKALGIRLPLFWMLTSKKHLFHDHRLGKSILHGFHALALDETRRVFEPVMWDCPAEGPDRVQQMWFRGAHGDIGGMIGRFARSRPLANIPLVWMIEKAEDVGLALPDGWRARYPCDATAPMVGTMRGWGMWFLLRRKRVIGRDPTEAVHSSVIRTHPRRWAGWPLIGGS